jgi:hypothetical protein
MRIDTNEFPVQIARSSQDFIPLGWNRRIIRSPLENSRAGICRKRIRKTKIGLRFQKLFMCRRPILKIISA